MYLPGHFNLTKTIIYLCYFHKLFNLPYHAASVHCCSCFNFQIWYSKEIFKESWKLIENTILIVITFIIFKLSSGLCLAFLGEIELIKKTLALYFINSILRRFLRYYLRHPPIVYRLIDAVLIGNFFDDHFQFQNWNLS